MNSRSKDLRSVMLQWLLSAIDLGLVGAATMLAFVVRDDFEIAPGSWPAKATYLAATLCAAAVTNSALRISSGIWRFTAFKDMLRLAAASTVTVVLTVILAFWIDRLEGVARSLPILQLFLILAFLVTARAIVRGWHSSRQERGRRRDWEPASGVIGDRWTVMVVGVNSLTEFYLRAVDDMSGGHVAVAGIAASSDADTGRAVGAYRVLGPVHDMRALLRQLEVHGVWVNRILVTERIANLSAEAVAELIEVENSTDIRLEFLAEQLGFESQAVDARGVGEGGDVGELPEAKAASLDDERPLAAQKRYASVKRLGDIAAAGTLLLVLTPVLAMVWALVAFSIGSPVLFWQRRPGRFGRNFQLFKFRTLGPSHAPDGRRLTDSERVSRVGGFLRNTRLDELPQLFNILIGDMSFVGPRPLLPVDQPAMFLARLAVRPGLTGWAQINGGRLVSIEDKGAMDMYYVRNMSFRLDVKVLLKTVPMVLFRERSNQKAVRRAWDDLRRAKRVG